MFGLFLWTCRKVADKTCCKTILRQKMTGFISLVARDGAKEAFRKCSTEVPHMKERPHRACQTRRNWLGKKDGHKEFTTFREKWWITITGEDPVTPWPESFIVIRTSSSPSVSFHSRRLEHCEHKIGWIVTKKLRHYTCLSICSFVSTKSFSVFLLSKPVQKNRIFEFIST